MTMPLCRAVRGMGGAAAAALLLSCGGQPEPATDTGTENGAASETLVAATPEEVAAEIEILGYEIADLQSYLAALPAGAPPPPGDPAPPLARAARARDAAMTLAGSGSHAAAAESLSAAMRHTEEVKRALGLAEEFSD